MSTKTYYISRLIMLIILVVFIFLGTTGCDSNESIKYDDDEIITPDIIPDPPADDDDGSTTTITDTDGDGILDENDNCVYYINADQLDTDADGVGDECDTDDDGDGVKDGIDACPTDPTETTDTDADGICDNTDNCVDLENEDQADDDGDGVGDLCDTSDDDPDEDGLPNSEDNCPADANEDQADIDEDGAGDACDNCLNDPNEDQADLDADDIGDICDEDIDGDGDLAIDFGGTDCDDENANTYVDDGTGVSAAEIFDLADNDCDALVDEDIDLATQGNYIDGTSDYDNFGLNMAGVGDVNGDGYDDILISSPWNDNAKGKIYLFLGHEDFSGELLSDSADVIFTGENDGDLAGLSVAAAGDVNNDGYDDILIGAPFNDEGGSGAGKAYLIYGANFTSGSLVNLASADISFTGSNTNDVLGIAVSTAGDADEDKKADILISAPGFDSSLTGTNVGKIYLFYGKNLTSTSTLSDADKKYIGEKPNDYAGTKLATAGDFNGDGADDFIVGAPFNDDSGIDAGKIYVVFGEGKVTANEAQVGNFQSRNFLPLTIVPTNLDTADISYTGLADYNYIGTTISGGGVDVNGDGLDDFAVGVRYNDEAGLNAGKTYFIYGSESLSGSYTLYNANTAYTGEHSSDYSGTSVALINDLNDDGYGEVLIGASGYDATYINSGKLYLVLGEEDSLILTTFSLEDAAATFLGSSSTESVGGKVTNAGDVNGDGKEEIITSGYGYDGSGTAVGRAYIIFLQ